MSGFSQGFGDVRARARQGQNGDFSKVSHLNALLTGINSIPQSKQVSTLDVTDPGDNVTGTITINGVAVDIDTGTGLDQDGVGALIATNVNAEPLVRGSVVATFDTTTDVLTLTSKLPGDVFTVSESFAGLANISTVSSNKADAVPFGRAVVLQGTNPGEVEDLVALAKSTRFTAQVLTATVDTGQATDRIASVYEIRGTERILIAQAGFTGSGTAATEATNIAAALNAALPANTVLVTTSTADVIFTAEVVGSEFEVDIQTTVGAVAAAYTFVNTTGPSISTSFHRAFGGISMYSPNDEAATIGGTEGVYAANAGVRYAVRGELWLTNDQAPDAGDTVYVELADGDDSGKFFNTDSATRLAVSRAVAQWRRAANLASDELSALHLDTGRAP